jgi:hypothetical protein
MRTLYFDIDGTILSSEDGAAKIDLCDGVLETAIRRARFTHLICVGNIGIVANEIASQGIDYDAIEVVFRLCDGAFQDIEWFRSMTRMVADPEKRAEAIDLSYDWWYLDDLAAIYLRDADRAGYLTGSSSHRVFIPDPGGSGNDILEWLNGIPV